MLLDWNSNKEKRRMHHDNDQSVFTPFSLLLMFMMDIPSSFFVDLNVSTFFSLILGDTFGCHFFYSFLIKWVEGKERRRWRNECECDELFLPLSLFLFLKDDVNGKEWDGRRIDVNIITTSHKRKDVTRKTRKRKRASRQPEILLCFILLPHPPLSSSSWVERQRRWPWSSSSSLLL